MRALSTLLFILCFQSAQAQESFDPPGILSPAQIERNAWNFYCQNSLAGEGKAAFCDCVIAKQNEVNDPRIVEGSLLQLVNDDENASDQDNQTAQHALVEMYSGDDLGAATDMRDFKSSLSNSINTCTVKPKS